MRTATPVFLIVALLAGCGDWPDLATDDDDTGGWGTLAPTAAFDAAGALPADTLAEEREESARLAARADVLRARAATTGLTPADRAELDALVRILEERGG